MRRANEIAADVFAPPTLPHGPERRGHTERKHFPILLVRWLQLVSSSFSDQLLYLSQTANLNDGVFHVAAADREAWRRLPVSSADQITPLLVPPLLLCAF